MLDKPLPHDSDAEKLILGGILLNNELILDILGDLKPEHFYAPAHKPIYAAMERLADTGRDINHITIPEALKELGESFSSKKELLELIGDLRRGVPKPKSLVYYAKLLKDRAVERDKIRISEVLKGALLDGDPERIEEAEYTLQTLSSEVDSLGLEHTGEFSEGVARKIFQTGTIAKRVTGVATGIADFDTLTTGLQSDDFVIVAARPGAGKTALCLSVAQFAALKRSCKIAVFSLEMSKPQLYMRMLSSEARVPLQKIRTGFLSSHEWARLIYAKEAFDKAEIYIDDTVGMSPMRIKAVAKKMAAKARGLDLIIIDYLQLMELGVKVESRQQEVSAISRQLKNMAKELHVPVLALSQLSRAPEQRAGNHKPRLSDLRESGSLEQDADIVAFIYREEMYGKTPENEGLAEFIIEKHRNGETDTIHLAYTKDCVRFENLFLV